MRGILLPSLSDKSDLLTHVGIAVACGYHPAQYVGFSCVDFKRGNVLGV
jgi:hypothetical protein